MKQTLDMVRSIRRTADIKVGRNFDAFFADRIIQSASEPSLITAMDRLARSVNAKVEYIGGGVTAGFMQAAGSMSAGAVLAWMRQNPRVTAMVAALRDDADYANAVGTIMASITSRPPDESVMAGGVVFDIPVDVELLSPLAHGSDDKAGNATLFRRRKAITETGRTLDLPFYGGNAVRGLLRDILADHLLLSIGLTPRRDKPPVKLWFFYALYSGGVLEEGSKHMDRINAELGKSGAVRTDGLRRFRDMLPALSLLGCALGNRVLPGRVYVGDLRPVCREWGFIGAPPVSDLMAWEYLTRREDLETHEEHHGMIANTECLRTGAALSGGIDIDTHASEIERSAIGAALSILQGRGMLGASNRRGFGKCRIGIRNLPDPKPYNDFLAGNKAEIIAYLESIGAVNDASDTDDIPGDF